MTSVLPYTSGHRFKIHQAIIRGASLFTLPDHLLLPDDAASLVIRSVQGSAPDFTASTTPNDLMNKIQHAESSDLRWKSAAAVKKAWQARDSYSNVSGANFIKSYAILGSLLGEPKRKHPVQDPREIRAILSDIVSKVLRDPPLNMPALLDEFRRNTLLRIAQLQIAPEEIERATDPGTLMEFQTNLSFTEIPVYRAIKAIDSYVCLMAACMYSPKLCNMFEETLPRVATRIDNLFEYHGRELTLDDHRKLAQNWTVLAGAAHHAGLSHKIDQALGWNVVENVIKERLPPQSRSSRPKPCQR